MPRERRSKYANDAVDNAQLASSLAQKANKTDLENIDKGSPKGVFSKLSDLQAAYPTGNSNVYLVAGSSGVQEVDTLTITGAPTLSSNVTVTLNGVAKTISVSAGYEVASLTFSSIPTTAGNITVTLNGVATNIAVDPATDTTTTLVANKVRATSFPGWTVTGSGANITFTATTVGTKTDITYSAGTTGCNATPFTNTQGGVADDINGVATKIRNTAFTGWTTGGTGATVTFTANTVGTNSPPIFSAGTTGVSGTMTVTTAGVNVSTSNWYYWNASTWVSGGSYQSTGIADNSIKQQHLTFLPIEGVQSKNLFNKDTITSNKALNTSGGTFTSTGYFVSDYINVIENTYYFLTTIDSSGFDSRVSFYDQSKVFISEFVETGIFQTPANAKFARFSNKTEQLATSQIELGTKFTGYSSYGTKVKPENVDFLQTSTSLSSSSRIYSLNDAWLAWENGEKFPVGFFGDSTTDGHATSSFTGHQAEDDAAGGLGKADHIAPNAYSKKLQDLIRAETGSTTARIYNIGYGGMTAQWGRTNIDAIFSDVYADVKMVGIVWGLNDLIYSTNTKDFVAALRDDFEFFIKYFYDKAIQPFFVTPQATLLNGVSTAQTTKPLVTSEHSQSLIGNVMKELANKYDLEIIDMNAFGDHFLTYSQYTARQVIADNTHFGDVGHNAEAGFIFSHFCPRVMELKDNSIISFASQKIKSNVPNDLLTMLTTKENGFKLKANYTKADSNDLLLKDFYVLNLSKGLMDLTSCVTAFGTIYAKLDDTTTVLTSTDQLLSSSVDIGLHRIQAYTGASTTVDFKGFKMKQVPVGW
jgi:hypothetical protein